MTRIKIKDLLEDNKISAIELRRIFGGGTVPQGKLLQGKLPQGIVLQGPLIQSCISIIWFPSGWSPSSWLIPTQLNS